MLGRAFVIVIVAGLLGCGGSAPAPRASTQVDAGNPREPIARGELVLVPEVAPPVTPAPAASYTPWPGFGHDPEHTGSARVRGPQTGAVRWTRELEGAVVPGPAIGKDGTVYAASNGGVLHALDPATGKDRWTFDGGGAYGSDLSTVPLVLPGGDVLWPGPNQTLFALAPDGRERWRAPRNALTYSSAAVTAAGVAYYGDHRGALNVVDARSGEVLARHVGLARTKVRGDVGVWTAPAIDREGSVYFGTRVGRVYSLQRHRAQAARRRHRLDGRLEPRPRC